jgi:Ca-activated chloride channel family protein
MTGLYQRTRRLLYVATVLGTMLAGFQFACADSGVLIPKDKQAPDPSILSLTEMQGRYPNRQRGCAGVGFARSFQITRRRSKRVTTSLHLPSGTQVSDFAVWDGPVRIPAVILERKRAQALYQELKSQAIDPGLLQQGERTDDDARRNSVFSAHIVPIPAWGTKRLEMEYHQRVPVEARKSYFVLPLKPDAYQGPARGAFDHPF